MPRCLCFWLLTAHTNLRNTLLPLAEATSKPLGKARFAELPAKKNRQTAQNGCIFPDVSTQNTNTNNTVPLGSSFYLGENHKPPATVGAFAPQLCSDLRILCQQSLWRKLPQATNSGIRCSRRDSQLDFFF